MWRFVRGGIYCVKGGWWIAEGTDGAGGKQDGHCAAIGGVASACFRYTSFICIWMGALSG